MLLQYPAQVCRMGLLYHWTRECDLGIAEIKYDRKALQGTLKKYMSTVARLSTVLTRGQWRSIEDPMLPIHKNRLECMITVSMMEFLGYVKRLVFYDSLFDNFHFDKPSPNCRMPLKTKFKAFAQVILNLNELMVHVIVSEWKTVLEKQELLVTSISPFASGFSKDMHQFLSFV